jgi:rhodanese-related sulfurtransferase
MPNPYGAPEISAQEVSDKIDNGEKFILLDVRERHELAQASFAEGTFEIVPLSELAQKKFEALPPALQDKDAEIVAFCHKGVRSAQVTMWLKGQGWTNVLSMAGGIDAWAKQIDPDVGMY